ncbi:unnamed protein product [Allacma fusca]|uniref:Acrosin n=1 Tax=Allacma fusca TaxID=39272 RepID=A0A8J2L659_9HEXA|nr:unnamed protein product [Allacma fusca]
MKIHVYWCGALFTMTSIYMCTAKTAESIKNINYIKEVGPDTAGRCCSTVISDMNFRITNPSYPEVDSGSRRYFHKIQMQSGTCALRIMYKDIKLHLPGLMSSACSLDSITILAPQFPTQPQCGFLDNFLVNVPVKEGDEVEILVVVQSTKYSWNMVISQIPCSEIESKPLAKYEEHCGKRPRHNFLWNFGVHELDSGILDNVQNEIPQTIINDPDVNSYHATGDFFRCHMERVVDKIAAKTVQNNRIVNGQTARRSWPWQVVLLIKGRHLLCGGALIAPNLAITAGHCLKAVQKALGLENLVIAMGVQKIGTQSAGVQYRRCKHATIHPQYAEINQDIGLCYFDEPIEVSDKAVPICLPYEKDHTFAGEKGIITGWGRTSDHGTAANILQEAAIPIVTNEACSEAWEQTGGKALSALIDSTMLCGGGNNRSTCNGDSGGPLSIHNSTTDRYTLIGLTSFGPSSICNVPGKPLSVFTRITSQLPFLSMATAEISLDAKNLKVYLPC